jgi:hypothetical protein
MSLNFWKNASSRRKRIVSIIAIFVVALVITVLGMLAPLTAKEANDISQSLNQTVDSMKTNGGLTPYIFGNNLMICLAMFVPIAGPIFGLYALFNTGTAITAIATSQGYPPIVALFAEFLTPIFWLEFAAYSIAIAESIWLLWAILQKRSKREVKNVFWFVTICAVTLLVSAFIETWIISIA